MRANVDEAEFTRALNRIHDYIAAGDTYQVNYTYRLRFDAFGSLHALYARLRARQPVPYGALVAPARTASAVLSLSPELFVRHTGGELVTRPMKGTAPARGDDAEDARRAAALAQDPKNRAENLMIVDLLRNDLGRIAETGSVEVPALFDVQRYSSVLQMTSTVRAHAAPRTRRWPTSSARSTRAARSPARPSGAPWRSSTNWNRRRAASIPARSAGSIRRRTARPIGDFCMSVPIRTLALQAPRDGVRRGEMGVGAGIVFDSDPADEFAECQLKARFLTGLANDFELFETMRATGDGMPPPATLHLARMEAVGARILALRSTATAAEALVAADAARAGEAGAAYGSRCGRTARCRCSAAPLAPLQEPVALLLADDADAVGRPLPAPQNQRAHALRRRLARCRGAGRLRYAVLQ